MLKNRHANDTLKRKTTTFIRPKEDFAFRELFNIETVRNHFISDVTGIPLENIKSSKLLNSFLWQMFRQQKLGIVDVMIELSDKTKVTIEIQLRKMDHWDKRQLFYWAKTFVKDLIRGENFEHLTKCISIAILDFNLSGRPKAHTVYHLTDEEGNRFSDMIELHTIELKKSALQELLIKDWIELLNAEKEEDFDMLMSKTKNKGIQDAIYFLRQISPSKKARIIAEMQQKERLIRNAEDSYVRNEGRVEGISQGMETKLWDLIRKKLEKGKSIANIAEELETTENEIREVIGRHPIL